GQVGKTEAGILPYGHDAHDGRMAERAQGLRLADEPHARLAVRGGLEDLERRDHAVAHHRVHAVDRAHPAFAEAVLDDPVADAVACAQHPFTGPVPAGTEMAPRTAVAAQWWSWSGAEASWPPAGGASSAEATDGARPRARGQRRRRTRKRRARAAPARRRQATAPGEAASPARARRR